MFVCKQETEFVIKCANVRRVHLKVAFGRSFLWQYIKVTWYWAATLVSIHTHVHRPKVGGAPLVLPGFQSFCRGQSGEAAELQRDKWLGWGQVRWLHYLKLGNFKVGRHTVRLGMTLGFGALLFSNLIYHGPSPCCEGCLWISLNQEKWVACGCVGGTKNQCIHYYYCVLSRERSCFGTFEPRLCLCTERSCRGTFEPLVNRIILNKLTGIQKTASWAKTRLLARAPPNEP
jgi:hypothetical protein